MAVWSVVKVSELEGAKRLDAEYYQPKYRIDFSTGSWVRIGDALGVCQYGLSKAMIDEPVGYPIFRMDDIKNAFLVDDEVKYVDVPEAIQRKYELQRNDVLFNRVNSEEFVGRTGIFKLRNPHIFASYLIRLRVKDGSPVLPDYLNVFLNSSLGIRQIRKLSRRAVNQANVNAEELKGIRIAILPKPTQEKIGDLCDLAFEAFERSKAIYLEAECMVLNAIGWDKLNLSQPKWWAVQLSRARETSRLDAEHFQPKYDRLIAHLQKIGKAQQLGELAPFIKRGLQPDYAEDGEILVVNSQHLGRFMVNVEATERTDAKFWDDNKRCRLQRNDVLLYATGAYVGRTNVWLEARKAVASNHVTVIRPGKPCDPAYLAVFLNTPCGIFQADQWASGSGQREIYPEDIARIWVALTSEKVQQQVAKLVQESYTACQKAKALLAEAKAKVEALIEGRRS